MTAPHHDSDTRHATVLLVPLVLVLAGLLLYFFVEILPTVRVLPG